MSAFIQTHFGAISHDPQPGLYDWLAIPRGGEKPNRRFYSFAEARDYILTWGRVPAPKSGNPETGCRHPSGLVSLNGAA